MRAGVPELRYNLFVHRAAVIVVLAAALAAPVLSRAQARGMTAVRAPVAPHFVAPRATAPAVAQRGMRPAVRPVPTSRLHNGMIAGTVLRRSRNGHHVFFNTPCLAPNWVNPLCFPFGFNGFPFFGFGGFGYGGYAYPYVYPPIYGMDYSSYQTQPAPQQQPVYVQDNTALQNEVSRLADEVERLRDQQAEQQARQRTPPPATPLTPSVPTALVYRDGHRAEVQNYAVVGQTLWIFNETHARKVPLSELNLPATRAANEQRGVEFLGPK